MALTLLINTNVNDNHGGWGTPTRGGGVIPDTPSPYRPQFYGSQAN